MKPEPTCKGWYHHLFKPMAQVTPALYQCLHCRLVATEERKQRIEQQQGKLK